MGTFICLRQQKSLPTLLELLEQAMNTAGNKMCGVLTSPHVNSKASQLNGEGKGLPWSGGGEWAFLPILAILEVAIHIDFYVD